MWITDKGDKLTVVYADAHLVIGTTGAAFDAFAAESLIEYLPFNRSAGAKYAMLGRGFAPENVI